MKYLKKIDEAAAIFDVLVLCSMYTPLHIELLLTVEYR